MKKLYEKNQLAFALVWIGIYCALQSAAYSLDDLIGVRNAAGAVLCAVQAAALLAFLKKNGLFEAYGLCRPRPPARRFLYYIPLAALATCNLWNGAAAALPPADAACHIALMLCVGFVEELIFRGFLYRAIARENERAAVAVSSLTFGLGHLLNLVNGSGMDLAANLFQVASAMAFGFLFVVLFSRGGSLLPCIAAHAVINITSAFANEAAMTPQHRAVSGLATLALAVAYALALTKTLPPPSAEKNR